MENAVIWHSYKTNFCSQGFKCPDRTFNRILDLEINVDETVFQNTNLQTLMSARRSDRKVPTDVVEVVLSAGSNPEIACNMMAASSTVRIIGPK